MAQYSSTSSYRRISWATAVAICGLTPATPSIAGQRCAGISLSQALVELGQKSGITLAFNAARVPRRCVDLPRGADPMEALAKLARQSGLRLVTLRPNLYALLPAARPPAGEPRASRDGAAASRAPSTSLSDDSIVVLAKQDDSQAAEIVSRLATAPVDLVSAGQIQQLPSTGR